MDFGHRKCERTLIPGEPECQSPLAYIDADFKFKKSLCPKYPNSDVRGYLIQDLTVVKQTDKCDLSDDKHSDGTWPALEAFEVSNLMQVSPDTQWLKGYVGTIGDKFVETNKSAYVCNSSEVEAAMSTWTDNIPEFSHSPLLKLGSTDLPTGFNAVATSSGKSTYRSIEIVWECCPNYHDCDTDILMDIGDQSYYW